MTEPDNSNDRQPPDGEQKGAFTDAIQQGAGLAAGKLVVELAVSKFPKPRKPPEKK